MSACDHCSYNHYKAIKVFYEEPETSVDFLRRHGVLPTVVSCTRCNKNCTFREQGRTGEWRCNSTFRIPKTKKRRHCSFYASDYKGTFLQNSHIPPWKVILFVNHWLSKRWDHQTVTSCLNITPKTSVNWRSFCSEVAEFWLGNQDSIGGQDIVVEIDGTFLVRRKNNKDRPLSQIWLFGGIERDSKKKFVIPLLEPVGEKRDTATLLPLIKKYIRGGSIIMSDRWGAYHSLKTHGYTHYMINHSQNFGDPTNINIHTQTIERLWMDLKEWVKRPGIRATYLRQYLARYLFITNYDEKEALLHHFFVMAGRLYPPQGEHQRVVAPVLADEEFSDEEEHDDAN